jgi:hypothetical protein
MVDITIAEFNGSAWLVGGEAHIDDLLANTLADDITIEFVPCDSIAAVRSLWIQNCGPREEDGTASQPWMIHPAIANRTRRMLPDHAVFFAQWSVLLDQDALAVIRAAAVVAIQNPEQVVQIAEYLDEDTPRSIRDLSRLRATLVEEALVEEGIATTRMKRILRSTADVPGMSKESQRVDVIVSPD